MGMRAARLMGMVATAAVCGLALPAGSLATEHEEPPTSFEPVLEAENFSITQQRQAVYDTPEYQVQLAEQSIANREEATKEQVEDPERNFSDDLCFGGENGCAGDVRLYDWEANNFGRVRTSFIDAPRPRAGAGADLDPAALA